MKKILFLLSVVAVCANAEYIGSYYAKLGVADHFNSHGKRLKKVAAIIRQDRFNYHIRGIRQPGDTGDFFFDSKRNREVMERMIRNGYISPSARREIIYGTPLIKVDIYRDHVNVKIIHFAPKSTVE